jgi:hypothetical protein
MTVYRWTWLIKNGHLGEAAELAEEGSEKFWKPEKAVQGAYTSDVGPGNTLVYEVDAKDEAQFAVHFQHLDKWSNTSIGKDFWKRFNDTIERYVSVERWNLVT